MVSRRVRAVGQGRRRRAAVTAVAGRAAGSPSVYDPWLLLERALGLQLPDGGIDPPRRSWHRDPRGDHAAKGCGRPGHRRAGVVLRWLCASGRWNAAGGKGVAGIGAAEWDEVVASTAVVSLD
jgi:hypothetical protein